MLTHHRLWGTLIVPYIIRQNSGQDYYTISEALFPSPSGQTLISLLPEERDVVTILNQFSERELFRLFSKEKNVKAFVESLTSEKNEKFIRPYIERRIGKCLEIARDEGLPLFRQKSDIKTLHEEDRLNMAVEYAKPVFRFERNNVQSLYSLNLDLEGKPVDLRKNRVEIICSSPCIIQFDSTIAFVSDIDGAKLKPFLSKEAIVIPKNSQKKYFATFVLNAVNRFRVEADGFQIISIPPDKKAYLSLETGLKGTPVLILSFSYSGKKVWPHEKELSFTEFEDKKGEFIFRKYERDCRWEEECSETLGALGFATDDGVNFYIPAEDGKPSGDLFLIIEAVNNCWEELTAAGFTLSADHFGKKYNLKPVTLVINCSETGDWFDLHATVIIGGFEIPFIKLKRNILSGIREYELPDKTIAILPEEWFSRYKSIFEFGRADDETIRLHKQHFPIISEISGYEKKGFSQKLEKLLLPDSIPSVNVKKGLLPELRKYQTEGVSWLVWLKSVGLGGCLADDMGLGKTIQALSLLLISRENEAVLTDVKEGQQLSLFDQPRQTPTSLIIVPASLIYNWENEIKRFAPAMKFYSQKGSQREKNISHFGNYDIILSSYHTVRQDIEFISAFHFHYVILDESQVIKNPSSMVFRSVSMLKSDYRLVLTGTPIQNSLTDLWAQLNFVNPGLLGSLPFFIREYVRPVEKMKDYGKEAQLKSIIKPFILRRTKEMVASDLPPLHEQTIFCDMTDEQARLYEKEKSAVRNTIMKNMETRGSEKSAIMVLQGLMRLRQISNHPLMAVEDYTGGSGKFEVVTRDIENVTAGDHKILIFSSFVKHLMLYADFLSGKKMPFAILTGSSTNRGEIIERFRNDPECKVFLISLKAGGVGLNLTEADYVFILDPWWNPSAEVQALSRAHRTGQKKGVFVNRYISGSSIEEKIIHLQGKKSKLADTFIRSNNPLKDIDMKNILEIID